MVLIIQRLNACFIDHYEIRQWLQRSCATQFTVAIGLSAGSGLFACVCARESLHFSKMLSQSSASFVTL